MTRTRTLGFTGSFLAASLIAVLPFQPARADIAPADPIEPTVAGAAADPADLPARLVGAGLPAGEAAALVARLAPEERAYVAERAGDAQVGGYLVIFAPFLVAFGIWAAALGIYRLLSDEPETPAAPAPEDGEPSTLAKGAKAAEIRPVTPAASGAR